jgi:hypothetical protein
VPWFHVERGLSFRPLGGCLQARNFFWNNLVSEGVPGVEPGGDGFAIPCRCPTTPITFHAEGGAMCDVLGHVDTFVAPGFEFIQAEESLFGL